MAWLSASTCGKTSLRAPPAMLSTGKEEFVAHSLCALRHPHERAWVALCALAARCTCARRTGSTTLCDGRAIAGRHGCARDLPPGGGRGARGAPLGGPWRGKPAAKLSDARLACSCVEAGRYGWPHQMSLSPSHGPARRIRGSVMRLPSASCNCRCSRPLLKSCTSIACVIVGPDGQAACS